MPRIGSKERIRRFLRPRVGKIVTALEIQETVGPEVTEGHDGSGSYGTMKAGKSAATTTVRN